ncbi:MAG: glycosyltransferase family 39 protein [Nitrospiraceae bacterium]
MKEEEPSREFSQEHVGVLLPALLVTAVAVGMGQFDLPVGPRAVPFYHRGEGQPPWNLASERLEGPWKADARGVRLAPGQSGALTVKIDRNADTRLALTLAVQAGNGAHYAVSVSGDGETFHEVAQDRPFDREALDLPPDLARQRTVWVKLTASVAPDAPAHEPLVVTQVRLVGRTAAQTWPNLPLASFVALTPVLAYAVRWSLASSGAGLFGLVVLAGMAVLSASVAAGSSQGAAPEWAALFGDRTQDVYLMAPYAALLGLWGWHIRIWNGVHPSSGHWGLWGLLGAVAWGGSERVIELAKVWGSRLDTDTLGYITLAGQMQGPYDTGKREPLYLWLLKGWFALAGSGELQIRAFTMVISLGLIVAAYKFFRDYTGQVVIGVLIAWLLSQNPYLVSLSVRGLRDEAFGIAVLAVAYLVFVPGLRLSLRGQAAGLAVAGAAAQLLRLTSAVFLLPLFVGWAWKQGWRKSWLLMVAALLFVGAVFVPHLAHNSRAFGDPLYSLDIHAKFFRNTEFMVVKQTTCEGCPTMEELAGDREAGRRIGPLDYLFGMHSIGEVARATLASYRDVYLSPTWWFESQVGTRNTLVYLWYLLGLALVLASPYRAMLAMIVVVANVIPFMLPFGLEPRHLAQTAPFATFVLAFGLWKTMEWTLNRPAATQAAGLAPG